jgi:hypothetical protein
MTQSSAVPIATTPSRPVTAEQRASFDRDGYLVIRGALRRGNLKLMPGSHLVN